MNGIPAKPEKEFRVGAVRVAVWTNPRHAADGRIFNSHKIQVERTYKDVTGKFACTNSLDTNDIPKAILALKKAYEYLTIRDPTNQPSSGPQYSQQEPFKGLERVP